MSGKWETVQLEGIDMLIYFMEHFKMTPDEALADMEEHGQDTTEAKKFVYLYQYYQLVMVHFYSFAISFLFHCIYLTVLSSLMYHQCLVRVFSL